MNSTPSPRSITSSCGPSAPFDGVCSARDWATGRIGLRRRSKQSVRGLTTHSILSPICVALAEVGTVTVINSLDHWPDLGIDLDLYSDGEPAAVVATMRNRFHAQPAKRSWGDRLASKWNFVVPGLPELVDVHVGRLGHMGEQSLIGESLVAGAVPVPFESHTFRVPAPEDRIMISTLQQMYSHFRIRLCDILELVQLADQGVIDYDYLRSLAQLTGIWDGVATYLKLVSDYVTAYRGSALLLPSSVISAARFGTCKSSCGETSCEFRLCRIASGYTLRSSSAFCGTEKSTARFGSASCPPWRWRRL